ncbi:MAG: sigma-54-dependent Fis family transcriptional regulator [Sandaracinaceae bacterium]|nr:sigma-54-dependent Fis family transcriptional regulator [Sandaracinaceae bacterium]
MSRPILLVDDDDRVRHVVERMLASVGHPIRPVASGAEALDAMRRETFALVITDVTMPGMSGLELLEHMRGLEAAPPTVVFSGEATIDRAVRAIQLGAVDFLAKPVERERLVLTVKNALRLSGLAAAHAALAAEAATQRTLVGSSPAMQELRELVARVAASEGRVLILGENGTGKELVAAAIHEGSPRADRPLVKLNCAAVPESLVESELFGHEKGAFTGALKARAGRFELADGGTLFLDEIGDMPAAMQAKLLRVLQEGAFERVGSEHTITVDVRVIAATNRDLDEMVDEGRFREDLLYRLNVVTVHVPPLRERAEDVPELARHFLAKAPPRAGRPLMLTDAALARLCRHDFPGNVRELANFVERLGILAPGPVVDEAEVERLLRPRRRAAHEPTEGVAAPLYRPGVAFKDLESEVERRILIEAIEAHGGAKLDAAAALGIERSHFYKKCRKHGIE